MERRLLVATAAVSCAVVSAGCGATTAGTAVTSAAPKLIARPLVERELQGLLLSPDDMTAVLGVGNMTVTNTATSMADNSAVMTPPECLAIDGAAEMRVYADSGFVAEREQTLSDGDKLAHYVKQAVVLFPTADQAHAFFTASAQQWPACHEYTHTQSQTRWSVGQISVTDDALSTVATEEQAAAPGRACGRALQWRNNVIADVNTCAADPADSAAKVADHIAANVAARW